MFATRHTPRRPSLSQWAPLAVTASLLGAVLLLATACSSSGDTSPSGSQATSPGTSSQTAGFTITAPPDIKSAGVLSICADIVYPPYTFEQNNTPVGFDVDMANDLAGAMGVRAEFHQTGFPGIIGALQGGKCDVIINGMNGTAEHAQVINQVSYLQDTQGFITSQGNPQKILSLDDLAGKTVATQLGSTDAAYLTQLNKQFASKGLPAMKITTLSQNSAAFEAVLTSRVDTFFQDRPVLGYYTTKFPGQVAVLDLSVNPQTVVIGLRKNEGALTTALQTGVQDMYRSGILAKIAAKWGIPAGNLLPKTSAS